MFMMNSLINGAIIQAMGVGLILVGVFSFFGLTEINQLTIFSFTVAGFLFLIAERLYPLIQKYEGKSKNIYRFFQALYMFVITTAMMVIMCLPYIKIEISETFLDKLSDMTLFIGLGITLILFGSKSGNEVLNFLDTWQRKFKQLEQLENNKTEDKNDN